MRECSCPRMISSRHLCWKAFFLSLPGGLFYGGLSSRSPEWFTRNNAITGSGTNEIGTNTKKEGSTRFLRPIGMLRDPDRATPKLEQSYRQKIKKNISKTQNHALSVVEHVPCFPEI